MNSHFPFTHRPVLASGLPVHGLAVWRLGYCWHVCMRAFLDDLFSPRNVLACVLESFLRDSASGMLLRVSWRQYFEYVCLTDAFACRLVCIQCCRPVLIHGAWM